MSVASAFYATLNINVWACAILQIQFTSTLSHPTFTEVLYVKRREHCSILQDAYSPFHFHLSIKLP